MSRESNNPHISAGMTLRADEGLPATVTSDGANDWYMGPGVTPRGDEGLPATVTPTKTATVTATHGDRAK
jgi:hypothetical protein